MLNALARMTLTSTAIAPVMLTYGWVAFVNNQNFISMLLAAGCLALVILCSFMLRYAQKELGRFNFSISSIEAADRENIGFLVLYLMPLFTEQFTKLNWDVWIPIVLVFAAVISTGYSYHFNPLLNLMGWHFYKVGTPEGVVYVLISRKQLRNNWEGLTVVQLTEYIVLDVGG